MEIEIIEKKKNPLLKREEVEFKLLHLDESTPTKDGVVSKLAAMLNADKNRTILKKIEGHYGVQYSIGTANLYDTAEDALEIEPKHILKRNGLLEENK